MVYFHDIILDIAQVASLEKYSELSNMAEVAIFHYSLAIPFFPTDTVFRDQTLF